MDGIVYLSQTGSRRISVPNLYADLCTLLPAATAQQLDALYRDPQVSTAAKMEALLAAFPAGCVLLLLDNFEDLLDERRELRDGELAAALETLLRCPPHAVKVIVTTRTPPYSLALVAPERQQRLELDEGLDSPYAENILRAMDTDGKLGCARRPTRCWPRRAPAPAAIPARWRRSSHPRQRTATPPWPSSGQRARLLPDNVVAVLVGEAYSRLDRTAQLVMEALAIYGRPVPAVAVDYLLQPYVPEIDARRC